MAVTDVGVAVGGLGTVIADAVMQFNKANVLFNLITTKSAPAGSLNVTFPQYTKVASSDVAADATGAEETDTAATSIITAATTVEVLRNVIRADITDLVQFGSDDSIMANAGAILGNAMAAKYDDDVVALFANIATTVGDGSAAITLLNIFDAVEALHSQSAPTVNGKYWGVFHPKQIWGTYGLINAIDGVSFDKTNEMLNTGYVGNIAGVEIFTTPEIDPATGTGSDEACGCIFSPQAFCGGYKEIDGAGFINIEPQRDASKALTELICNGYYAVDELVDLYAVRVLTAAQASS